MGVLKAADMVRKGQERPFRVTEGMIKSGRLPHTILFTGPEGAGKELFALSLAARLNCEGGGECGDKLCPSCSRMDSLEHPDVHLIYPVPYGKWEKSLNILIQSRREDFFAEGEFGNRARSIGINLIRHVIEATSKQPFQGRWNVVLIMEAHAATLEAQNAFLKLLEEPPRSTVIVLVTEFPDRLLDTIISRCQRMRFDPLSIGVVKEVISALYPGGEQKMQQLAERSDGNLRRAIRFMDQRFLEIRSRAVKVLDMVAGGDARGLLGESAELAGNYTREEAETFLSEMIIILREAMRARQNLEGGVSEEADVLDRLNTPREENGELRDLPEDIRRVMNAAANLGRNADVELTLSQLLLDLTGKWY